MKRDPIHRLLSPPGWIALCSLFMFSCVSTKKFNFSEAYKFSYYQGVPGWENKEKYTGYDIIIPDSDTSILIFSNQESGDPIRDPILTAENRDLGNQFYWEGISTDVTPLSKRENLISENESNWMDDQKPEKVKNTKLSTSGYRDTHPAFKGFILTITGFGIVLTGALIADLAILSMMLVGGGFILVGIGFYLMIREL